MVCAKHITNPKLVSGFNFLMSPPVTPEEETKKIAESEDLHNELLAMSPPVKAVSKQPPPLKPRPKSKGRSAVYGAELMVAGLPAH